MTECAICLHKCVHPAKLECNHIFCFLCIKGAAYSSGRCPMCRQAIPESYFESPQLLEEITEDEVKQYEEGYQWFYEGRNGWWLYDKRDIDQIEDAFQKKVSKCELLIAGFVYVIDFEKMMQYRRNEPQRQRRVKRDHLDTESTKGIAGLRRQIANHSNDAAPVSTCPTLSADEQSNVENVPPQSEQISAPDHIEGVAEPTNRQRYRRFSNTREIVTQVRSRRNRILSDEEQQLVENLQRASLRTGYRETYL
ncbi:E3 ubiquitin-protein ligase [Halotydeus destructor]|nr:E3 ubiquitin-protein ligase [Halotydeus destructor]